MNEKWKEVEVKIGLSIGNVLIQHKNILGKKNILGFGLKLKEMIFELFKSEIEQAEKRGAGAFAEYLIKNWWSKMGFQKSKEDGIYPNEIIETALASFESETKGEKQ